MDIHEILAKKLQDKRWSQARLSIESGIAQAQISRILNGKNPNLTLGTLRAFARALECRTIDLLPEKDKTPRPGAL